MGKMIEELKPCPFCGGESKVTEREGFAFFWCGECGASSKIAKESEAREYWNRRPAEDALKAEVDRLKEALSSIAENAEFWDDEDDSLAIIHRICKRALGDNPANGEGGVDEPR